MTSDESGERREPDAVKKLISDAKERQVEAALFPWLRDLVAKLDRARRGNNGGGTRKNPR